MTSASRTLDPSFGGIAYARLSFEQEAPMTDQRNLHAVEVSDGERAVTSAEVTTSTDPEGTARASMHAESGHIPPGSRTRLVDAVLDLPEVQDSVRLEATVPLGDTESLDRLRERTGDMTTHAAGSSALVNAELHPAPAPAPDAPEDVP
jgi:hypothetical protein